jgi:MFS transporter, SHS family, lactate transporter
MAGMFARVLPREPVGKDVWFLLFVVGTAFMASRYDFQLTTLALPQMQASLGLTDTQIADMTALAKLGAIPAVVATFLSDRIGRKPLFLWSIVGFSLAAIMASVAQTGWALTTALFLTRFFTMIDELLAVVLLVEAAPALARGWMLGALSACGAWGDGLAISLYGAFAGDHPDAWRWLYAGGALPALLTIWWRMKLPESRAYAATQASGSNTRQLAALKAVWKPAALIFLVAFLFWIPLSPALSLVSQHLQRGEGWQPGAVAILTLAAGTLGLVGTIFGGALADRFGRRPVALVGTLVAGAGMAGVYGGLGTTGVAAAYALGLLGWFAASVALRALMAETVPTEVRGTMAGLTEIANTSGAVVGILVVARLTVPVGSTGAAVLAVLPVIVLAGLAILMLRETRGQAIPTADSGAPQA